MVDDAGKAGGLAEGAKFVIAGDLNADPQIGDGDLTAIQDLHNHVLVNQAVTNGALIPVSQGGPECLASQPDQCKRNNNRPTPERITSSSGLQLDHVLPSANLNAVASGVFWPATSSRATTWCTTPSWASPRESLGSPPGIGRTSHSIDRQTGRRDAFQLGTGKYIARYSGARGLRRKSGFANTPRPLDEHPFRDSVPWLSNNSRS